MTMTTFGYNARTDKGESRTGTIEAVDEQSALEDLWKQNLLVIGTWRANASKKGVTSKQGKVPQRDLMVFTRQFATMLNAGLPIVQCLHALARQTTSGALQAVVSHVGASIHRGLSLSEALVLHPRVFNNLYVSMVQAGESAGVMGDILQRIAAYLEASERLRKKVRAALAYPVIVCVIAFCITAFLMLKIIPMFREIYRDFDGQLPTPTLMLIQVSDVVRHYFLACLTGMVMTVFLFLRLKRTRAGKLLWDKCKLRLPVVGALVQKVVLSRLVRTCAAMLRSGVPVLETLRIAGKSGGNVIYEAAVLKAAKTIEGGESLTEAMRRNSVFPPMLVEMVAAGEQTGHVPEMLDQVAGYYDLEIETTLSELTALIEPLLMAVLGIVVGTIVICMFLPIFKISQIVQF